MTASQSTDQAPPHVLDQIAAYLAGGLSAGERSAFDAHVAGCPGCGAALQQARLADSELVQLFADATPDDRFEDRLIAGLRTARRPSWPRRLAAGPMGRMILHPSVRRAAFGVAAAVALAAVGHAAKSALERQTLPGMSHGEQFAALPADISHWWKRGRSAKAENNLRQIGTAALMYSDGESRTGQFPRTYFDNSQSGPVSEGREPAQLEGMRAHRFDNNNVTASFYMISKTPDATPESFYKPEASASTTGRTLLSELHGISREEAEGGLGRSVNAASGTGQLLLGGQVMGLDKPYVESKGEQDTNVGWFGPEVAVTGPAQPFGVEAIRRNVVGRGTFSGRVVQTAAGVSDPQSPATGVPATPSAASVASSTPALPAVTLNYNAADVVAQPPGAIGAGTAAPDNRLGRGGGGFGGSASTSNTGPMVAGGIAPVTAAPPVVVATDAISPAINAPAPAGGLATGAGLPNNYAYFATPASGAVDGTAKDGKDNLGNQSTDGRVNAHAFGEGFKPTEIAGKPAQTAGEAVVTRGEPAATPTEQTAAPASAAPAAPGADANVVTRVYDVRDLVANVPDFADAPKSDLNAAGKPGDSKGVGGGGGGGGGGGTGLFGSSGSSGNGPKTREQAAEEVTRLVQETIAPETWRETGGQLGTVKELGGKLVVTQTPENLKRIDDLLKQIRDPKAGAPAGDASGKVVDGESAPVAKPQAAAPADTAQGKQAPAPDAAPPAPGTAAPVTPAPQRPAPTAAELQAQAMQRKIIRNGEMLFDVDAFDSSVMLVGKIAAEEGGFIATTDSEKLPNGKVKGSVIVRCPPERLDTLVLKLRGLGDLKSQRIAAQDITKQYTDLESQLRAAHAMEDRLLAIIKDGKGAIKDLLEAEKQLGVWREKVEGLQGEINYYNNLVSLSTLTVSLAERDIKTPYATAQSEQVSMGMVAEDVEKARTDAISEIEKAKGRILDSDLKKHEAGQFSATIVADVAPDTADPLIDRLKQIGRVARLDRERKQTSEGGTGAPPPGVKIERKDTRLQLSIYNLADVAPRTSTSMNLAAADVEKSYKSIVDQVKSGGGRIVSSQLNRPKPDQVTGTITFDVPSEKADVLSGAIRAGVEVMRLDVTENKDTQDVTDAKKGFVLQIYSLASVAPRETTILQVASKNVPAAFNKLLEAARSGGGRVITSQLNEQNLANVTGTLDFDVPRDNSAKVDAALQEAGVTVTRNVTRSPDSDSTVDSKVRLQVTLIDEINLKARQTITESVAARNVRESFNILVDALHDAGARIMTSQINDQNAANITASLEFDVPRENSAKVDTALRDAGTTISRDVSRSPDSDNTVDNKVHFKLTVIDQRALQPRETIAELVAVRDVPGRYNHLMETLRSLDAQVYDSRLLEQNKNDVSAVLNFAVRRDAAHVTEQPAVEKALGEASDVFSRTVVRSQDVTNTVDSKVSYQVTLRDADHQPPRETVALEAEAQDVDKVLADLEAAGIAVGGRAVDSTPTTSHNEKGELTGRIVLDVPLAHRTEIVNAVRDKGRVTATHQSRDDRVPEGDLSRARIEVTLSTGSIMAGEGSLWDPIKSGLRTSATGLMFALQFLIIGLCLIGPFVVALWILVKTLRWSRSKPPTSEASPGGPPGPTPAAA